jgi:hypothetical protein
MAHGSRSFKSRRQRTLAIAAAALSSAAAMSQAASLRVVTYNIDDDTGGTSGTDARVNYNDLGIILQAIGATHLSGNSQPIDVLALQELHYNNPSISTSLQSIVNTLNGIYGAGTYAYDTLVGTTDGNLTGNGPNGLIYNTRTVEDLGAFGLTKQADGTTNLVSGSAAARQPIRYLLRPMGYGPDANFYLYDSHYKSAGGTSNETRRQIEADAIRANADALGASQHIIYAGDYNLIGAGSLSNRTQKASQEPAYVDLTAAGNGQANDPLNIGPNAVGAWDNVPAFAHILTDPGNNLNDRFDLQLVSNAMLNQPGMQYVTGSYLTMGQADTTAWLGSVADSTNTHALTDLPNRSQVLNYLADLADVTDHLPTVADYTTVAVSLQNRYYLGPTGGTWTTDASWNSAADGSGSTGKPLPREIAHVIATGGVAKSVTFNADFSTNPLNTVYIDGNGVEAKLVQSSSTTTMSISSALIVGDTGIGHYVQSAGTVTLAGSGLIVSNQSGSTGTYELTGGALTTPTVTMGAGGTFSLTAGGTLNVASSFTNSGTTTFASTQNWSTGATFTNTAGSATFQTDAGSPSSSPLTITGTGGIITFAGIQHLSALSLSNTAQAMIASAASATAPTVVTLGSLSIDNTAGGASFDLKNNEVLISETLSALRTQIGGGQVTTTTNGLAIGSLDLGNNTVEARAVLLGDTNLDGNVNVADLANLAGNFGATTGGTWLGGDLDYNTTVNVADLADLAGNFGDDLASAGLSTDSTAVSTSAVVPEPTAFGVLGLTASAALAARRRRSRP